MKKKILISIFLFIIFCIVSLNGWTYTHPGNVRSFLGKDYTELSSKSFGDFTNSAWLYNGDKGIICVHPTSYYNNPDYSLDKSFKGNYYYFDKTYYNKAGNTPTKMTYNQGTAEYSTSSYAQNISYLSRFFYEGRNLGWHLLHQYRYFCDEKAVSGYRSWFSSKGSFKYYINKYSLSGSYSSDGSYDNDTYYREEEADYVARDLNRKSVEYSNFIVSLNSKYSIENKKFTKISDALNKKEDINIDKTKNWSIENVEAPYYSPYGKSGYYEGVSFEYAFINSSSYNESSIDWKTAAVNPTTNESDFQKIKISGSASTNSNANTLIIKCSYKMYKGLVLGFATYSGQERFLVTGEEYIYTTYYAYNVENKKNVKISKKIVKLNDDIKDCKNINVERGDEVVFRVVVYNAGDAKTKVKVTDKLAESVGTRLYLTEIGNPGSGNSESVSNATWSNATTWKGKTVEIESEEKFIIFLKFKVADNATAGKVTNTAKVYKSSGLDSSGTKSKTASASVQILGYKYDIQKSVVSICDKNNNKRKRSVTEEIEEGTKTYEVNETRYAEVGDIVKYKIVFRNYNSTILKNVNIEDTLPENLEYVSCSEASDSNGDWEITNSNQKVYIKMKEGTTKGKGKKTFYIEARVVGPINTSNTNKTLVNKVETTQVYNRSDVKLDNVNAKATIEVLKYSYKITKVSDKDNYSYGEKPTFTITVENTGKTNIKGIKVKDNVPTGLQFDSWNSIDSGWTKNSSNNEFTYDGVIGAGKTKSFTITYTIKKYSSSNVVTTGTNCVEIKAREVTNKAEIKDVKNENNINIMGAEKSASKKATKKINIYGYKYQITKIANKAVAEPGEDIQYQITVENLGNTGIKNIEVTDDLSPKDIFGNISVTGDGWIQTKKFDSSGKAKFKHEGVIEAGDVSSFTITCTVGENGIKKNNTNVNNKATISNVENLIEFKLKKGIYQEVNTQILGYDANISKYITYHKDVSENSEKAISDRSQKSNEEKNKLPVVVEQGDVIRYKIKLENTGGGGFEEPQIKDEIKDISNALKFKRITANDNNLWTYNSTTGVLTYGETLEGGNSTEVELEYEVVISNMYLPNIINEVSYHSILNKNKTELKEKLEEFTPLTKNKDYIRMDELDVGGIIWFDGNANGIVDVDLSVIEGVSNVKVILHDMDNHDESGNCNGNCASIVHNGGKGIDQVKYLFENVQKGTNRDKNGNYDKDKSEYKQYYLEFEYDGVRYQSAKYINKDNLTGDGNYNKTYEIDSNAAEITSQRNAFNESLETIYYNKATSQENKDKLDEHKDLSYTKNNQTSTLDHTEAITMSAFSFVNTTNGDIDKLWLYKMDSKNTVNTLPNTDYLKHINLGLYKRETTNLSLNTGLESFTETINGQELEYIRGSSLKENYNARIYKDDFDYRYTDYKDVDVQNEKTKDSELNIEVKYKTIIKNESSTLYTKLNEVTQYYSDNLKTIYDDSGNLYKQEMKIDRNNDGILDNTNKVYEFTAIYNHIKADGSIKKEGDVSFSLKSIYEDLQQGDELTYNKIYLSGFEDEVLAPGESIIIYTTYLVDKDSNRQLKILDKAVDAISEVNAYSTYIDEKGEKPAGVVDINSNPGNLGLTNDKNVYTDIKNKTFYEDDTKITAVAFVPETYERHLNGTVWEDTVDKVEDGEKIGNGILETGENKVSDVKVELIEIVKTKEGKVKEVNLMKSEDYSKNLGETRSDSSGNYTISNYKPGMYIVRFTYGDKNLVYNGQDYKSTIYKLTSENKEEENVNVLELTNDNRHSDARDDETRRLEVMEYSLEIYNEIAEVLKGKDSSNPDILKDKTYMYADTPTFIARIENVENNVKALDYIKTEGTSKWYKKYSTGVLGEIYDRGSFILKNIDFGMIKRPESNIELKKYVREIRVETSAGNVLFDLYYDIYDNEGNLIVDTDNILQPVLNEELSKGTENVQALNNTSTTQGFRYLNIDEELMQGTKLTLVYGFLGINNSQIDHLSRKLYLSDSEISGLSSAQIEERIKVMTTAEIKDKTAKAKYDSNNLNNKYFNSANYYGTYLGKLYYKGELGIDDIVTRIKIDNILDYVDNNLIFSSTENGGKWGNILTEELFDGGYLNENVFTEVTTSEGTKRTLTDIENVEYQTNTKNNLSITIDEYGLNPEMSILLKPGETASTYLMVSTILSPENNSDDMVYGNVAEIIKFTTLTGRRTTSEGIDAQTVGNTRVNMVGYIDSDVTLGEPDTSITEIVTLTPPTGGEYIPNNKSVKIIIYTISICIITVLGIIFIPKLISKIKERKFIK